jgi:hypothetical protein
MPLLYQEKHSDLVGVAASALSPMNIPVQHNHHGLLLNLRSVADVALTQAQIETDVEWISVHLTTKAKGIVKLLDRITPAEIFDLLNDYPEASFSTYTNAGCLYIPYTRPGRLRVQSWALSIGMADIEVYQLQVKFTAGLATVSKVEVIPVVDHVGERPLGEHIEMRIDTRPWATISEEPNIDMPHGETGTAIMTTHIGLGTAPGVIGNVIARLDDKTIYSDLDAAMNNFNLHRHGFTPNASYFHVPWDLDYEAMDVGNAKAFVLRLNWTTAPVVYRAVHELICGIVPSNPNVNIR